MQSTDQHLSGSVPVGAPEARRWLTARLRWERRLGELERARSLPAPPARTGLRRAG